MATFDVSIADDPGTNSAGTTGAPGTLSWALAQANAQAGSHTINITVDVNLTGPLSPIFNSVTKKADRVGFKLLTDGRRVRVFKSNGEMIDA